MTTRGSLKKPDTGGHSQLEPLPDPPREPDMQQRRRTAAFDAILMAHFAHRNDVLISGDGYLRHDPANEDEQFAPDCVVAFGVNPDAIVSRNGYVISEVGKPPDFVLEVASRSTGRRDHTVKRTGYAGYGVQEYWRFDHTNGRYHDTALAGRRTDQRRIHAGSDHPRARRPGMGAQFRVGLGPVLGPRGTATPGPGNGSVSADTGRAASSQGSCRGPSGRAGIRATSATRRMTPN